MAVISPTVGSSQNARFPARARPMRRRLSIIATLLLAVMLWTGGTAHAVEALGCAEVSGSESGHAGDRDKAPSDSGKALTHHHGSCHGQHNLVAPTMDAAPSAIPAAILPGSGPEAAVGDSEPPTALRPPIA